MRGRDFEVDYLSTPQCVVDSCPTVKFNIQFVSVLGNDGIPTQNNDYQLVSWEGIGVIRKLK